MYALLELLYPTRQCVTYTLAGASVLLSVRSLYSTCYCTCCIQFICPSLICVHCFLSLCFLFRQMRVCPVRLERFCDVFLSRKSAKWWTHCLHRQPLPPPSPARCTHRPHANHRVRPHRGPHQGAAQELPHILLCTPLENKVNNIT